MKVMLPKKNKRNVIILSILAFVFLASGIFLLWRVNQEKELSPDYSEAGADPGDPGGDYCCRILCCDGSWRKGYCQYTQPDPGENLCTKNRVDEETMDRWCAYHGGHGSCNPVVNPVVKCYCESWKDACGTNCTFPSGTQANVNAKAKSLCKAQVAMCKVQTGEVVIQDYTPSHPCYGKLGQCKNPYAPNPCTPTPPPPPPPEPVCDGGNWDNLGKPSGVYPYCSDINYSFVAKDSDGVDKNTLKTGDTEVRVKETLSTETNCLEPGDYTISAVWKDVKGAGGAGTSCALTTSFTVAEEIKNPDWNITKIPTESCIDDNTENPKAKLEYVITIENTGEGSGEIASIVDTLDSKVLQEYIEEISSNGEFSGGKISWTLTGTEGDFAPGQSKTYTYSFTVPKEAFGTYDNTVEAVPSVGNSLIANASIVADCVIQGPETPPDEPLPGTGIFDDSQGSLILGFALLILGFTWRIFGRGLYVSVEFLGKVPKKISIQMNDAKADIRAKKRIKQMKTAEKRKKNFERKVVKD
jgi:hypothetical protein